MLCRQFEHGYQIRFQRGEKVQQTLHAFLDQFGVEWGYFSAIGAVESVQIGFYRVAEKRWTSLTFAEELEVCSWSGNVAIRDGKPFAHAHAVLGREDGSTLGGHVDEA